MKKNIILLGALVISSLAYSQVGINNEDPKATLDVTAKTGSTKAEGIIAPRLTGDQIKGKDAQYLAAQTGTIVFATSASADAGVAATKTINITAAGYYYFDGAIWQKFNSGAASGTEPWYDEATNTGATANDQDIFQTGKVSVGGHRANGQTTNYEKFYISDTITTDAATRRFIGTAANRTATFSTRIIPTADLPATFTAVGTHSYVGLPSSFNGNGAGSYVIGESSRVDKTGTGTYQRLVGAKNEVTLSNGITTDATGTVGEVYINGTGSTSQDAYGFRSNLVVGNTATKQPNLTGYHSGFTSETVGKTGKFYGFVAGSSRDLPTHIQQVDDAYGFYVQESMENRITATNGKWAFYNDANIPSYFKGFVGIGTNAPEFQLDIFGDNASPTVTERVYSTGRNISQVYSNPGATSPIYNVHHIRNYSNVAGSYGSFNLEKYRGSVASPTAVLQNDRLGNFQWYGHNGTTTQLAAAIYSNATSDWSGASKNADIIFATLNSSIAGAGANEKMRLTSQGYLGIGTNAPLSALHLKSFAGGGADDFRLESNANGAAGSGSILFQRSNNTSGTTLTPATNGDSLGAIIFGGYMSSGSYGFSTNITSFYKGNGSDDKSNIVFRTQDTTRFEISENGKVVIPTVLLTTYANDAAADADATLPSGGVYKLNGNRQLFIKP